MSNIAGKAYAMNVLTPMKPSRTWINRLIFMFVRGLPDRLEGLLGLSLIHFARWTIVKPDQWPRPDGADASQADAKPTVKNDYMLFCSNFNGTWDQYIDAFSDGIPDGLDLFWYSSTKYPRSLPITPFKNYIAYNQIDTDYYYNATPGSAQRDVKCALKVYDALLDLTQKFNPDSSPQAIEEFAAAYGEALGKVQSCLGDPGLAPIASRDTANADTNRKNMVIDIWRQNRRNPSGGVV